MPDYKRLVSYIYNYEKGIKRNNVGYARVEARNGQCKCTLHIAAPSLNDKNLRAYMFKRREGRLEGVLLGTMQIRNGVGEYKTLTDTVLDDKGGIILYLSDTKFFATEWDDIPITMEMVATIENPVIEKNIVQSIYVPEEELFDEQSTKMEAANLKETEEIVDIVNKEDLNGLDYIGDRENVISKEDLLDTQLQYNTETLHDAGCESKPVDLCDVGCDDNAEDAYDTGCYDNAEDVDDTGCPDNAEEIDEQEDMEDCNNQAKPILEDLPLAKHLFLNFPRMYPFEDNEIAWCVRIEPQDIGLLPQETWVLGNNSFVLHGYYSYRHLIFCRINNTNGFNYILGVPGIYHNREKFMAKMFGFETFKCAKRKELKTGEFGYWFIPIVLN